MDYFKTNFLIPAVILLSVMGFFTAIDVLPVFVFKGIAILSVMALAVMGAATAVGILSAPNSRPVERKGDENTP